MVLHHRDAVVWDANQGKWVNASSAAGSGSPVGVGVADAGGAANQMLLFPGQTVRDNVLGRIGTIISASQLPTGAAGGEISPATIGSVIFNAGLPTEQTAIIITTARYAGRNAAAFLIFSDSLDGVTKAATHYGALSSGATFGATYSFVTGDASLSAGLVDGTTIIDANIFTYNPFTGVLESSNCAVATTDPRNSIACPAGFATYNVFGAVINLLSTANNAYFVYNDTSSSTQGVLIMAVSSKNGTDPVMATSYSAGLLGVDPVFGDFMQIVGATIHMGIGTVLTRTAQINPQQAPSNSQNPYLRIDAPEETTALHVQILLQGASPDGTELGQMLISQQAGSTVGTPSTNAMVEVQGQVTGTSPILQLIAQAAAANSFGIEVVGDGFNRFRSDSNGKFAWGTGAVTQDVNLYRGAANLLQTDDAIGLTAMSAPSGTASVSKLYSSSGQLATVNPQGLNQLVQTASQAAGSTNTITSATFNNLTSATVPAADATAIGNTYKLRCFGYGTWGSTQQALTIAIRFGATNSSTIGVNVVIAAGALSASAAFQWECEVTLMLASNPGLTTATWRANITGVIAETASALNPGTASTNSVAFSSGTGNTDITLDGSIAETLGISAEWASTTGAPTITKTFGQFERTS